MSYIFVPGTGIGGRPPQTLYVPPNGHAVLVAGGGGIASQTVVVAPASYVSNNGAGQTIVAKK